MSVNYQNTNSYEEEYPELPYVGTFHPFPLGTKKNKIKKVKTTHKQPEPLIQTYVHNNQVRHHLKKKRAL